MGQTASDKIYAIFEKLSLHFLNLYLLPSEKQRTSFKRNFTLVYEM